MCIAVIITTRDRPWELRRALGSVFAQTIPAQDVVVIDDASSPAVDVSIFEGAPVGLHCRLLRNDVSCGANVSRNRGLDVITADYVAFLDDDDEFLPGKLAALAKAIEEDAPDLIYHAAEVIYDNEGVRYVTRPKAEASFPCLLVGNVVGGTSVVCVRRDFMLGVGGFDEDMPALQDWEAWTRSAKAGGRFCALSAVLTRYHFVTGKLAISKSIEGLRIALSLFDERFKEDLAMLSAADRRRRTRTDVIRYAHRHAMNGHRLAAAGALLHGAFKTRSPLLLAGMPLALMGVKYLALSRARMGRRTT